MYDSREPKFVTAGEISRNFGRWQEQALEAPVVVTHHGRPRVVLVGAEHYRLSASLALTPNLDAARVGSLMNRLAEGFFAMDADLRLTAVNPVFEAYVARPASQLVGQLWTDIFPGLEDSLMLEHYRRVQRTGEVAAFEVASTVYPGRLAQIKAFPYGDGVGVLFVNRTLERDQERQMEEAAAFAAVVAAIPGLCTATLNLRGRLVAADADLATLTGFEHEDLLRCRLADIIRPRDRARLMAIIDLVLENLKPLSLTSCLLTRNGQEAEVRMTFAVVRLMGRVDGLKVAVQALAG